VSGVGQSPPPRRSSRPKPSGSRGATGKDGSVLLVLAIYAAVFWLPTTWGIVAIAAGLVVEVGEAAFWVWVSKRRRPAIGVEALVGATGTVVEDCRPRGRVRVAGETWRAVCAEGASAGAEVVVEHVEGDLTLLVTPK
jgi:membrane protein implicated in regulation of membrane protease activity